MPTPKEATSGTELQPLSIARMLWKRKTLIIVLWLCLSAVVGIVVWKLPPVYSAEAAILVDSQKIPDKYVTSTVSSDLQDRLATINSQILSVTRLKKVIDDLDLYREERKSLVEEEIIDRMRKDISVKVEKGWAVNRPGAFRIIYQGENPGVVAQVANRWASLYIEENMKTREIQAEGTSDFIETQLQQAKNGLDNLEAAVSAYKLKHSGELPQQENSLAGNLARLQVELEANRDAINRAQQTKILLESTLTSAEVELATHQRAFEAASTRTPGEPFIERPALPGQAPTPKTESESLHERLDILRLRYTDDYPEVKRVMARLDQLEKSELLSASPMRNPAGQAGTSTPAQRATGTQARMPLPPELVRTEERVTLLRTQLTLANNEIESRKAEQTRVIANIHNYQARIETLPVREQEMAQLTRDYEISKANYKSLLDKKLSSAMATDMERRQKSERFTVLDSASVPEKPLKPNRPVFAGGGILAALFLSLALAFTLEQRKGLFLGEWELPAHYVVLGRLPAIHFEEIEQRKARGSSGKKSWLRRPTLRGFTFRRRAADRAASGAAGSGAAWPLPAVTPASAAQASRNS